MTLNKNPNEKGLLRSDEFMICVENLKKSYKEVDAVRGISFNVKSKTLFSFLGTNGAGKSTTINILTTLLEKSSGTVKIDGLDLDMNATDIRKLIGVVFQESVLDPELTVYENLRVRGSLYGLKGKELKMVVQRVINLTGMEDYENRYYGKLSGGQRRRADIARTLIHTPKLLFLDEPTTGLDPKTRQDIWDLILRLKDENEMTIFLTTHYMEEAVKSDDIAIIHKGKILAAGTPAELKEKYGFDRLKMTLQDGELLEYKLKHTTDALPIIEEMKGKIVHVEIISGTLDEVFINLTGGGIDVN